MALQYLHVSVENRRFIHMHQTYLTYMVAAKLTLFHAPDPARLTADHQKLTTISIWQALVVKHGTHKWLIYIYIYNNPFCHLNLHVYLSILSPYNYNSSSHTFLCLICLWYILWLHELVRHGSHLCQYNMSALLFSLEPKSKWAVCVGCPVYYHR